MAKRSPKAIDPMDPTELDLSDVVANAQERYHWSDTTANHAELWYRRFLVVSQRLSSKSGKVQAVIGIEDVSDDLWHEHIAATVTYARDCNKMFGGFLNHTPGIPKGAQPLNLMQTAERQYLDAFGVAPPYIGVCCT